MSTFLITVFVILWVISGINSVRKAVAKAQAAAGGPGAIQSAIADAAAQSESAARTAAAQRAGRVLRLRMQAAVAGGPAVFQAVSASPATSSTPMPAYKAPPADQPMSSLIDMAAPSMPTFDASTLDAGFASLTTGLQDTATAGTIESPALAGRQIFVNEGARAGAAAIVASAIIGPPTGLRAGNQIASDW
jgi:hypothetical protein